MFEGPEEDSRYLKERDQLDLPRFFRRRTRPDPSVPSRPGAVQGNGPCALLAAANALLRLDLRPGGGGAGAGAGAGGGGGGSWWGVRVA